MKNKKKQLMISVLLFSFVCVQVCGAAQILLDQAPDGLRLMAEGVVGKAVDNLEAVAGRAHKAVGVMIPGDKENEELSAAGNLERLDAEERDRLDQQEDDEVVSLFVGWWRRYGWATKSHGQRFEKRLKADMDQGAVETKARIEAQIAAVGKDMEEDGKKLESSVHSTRLFHEEGMKQSSAALQRLRDTSEKYHEISMTEVECLGSKITEMRTEIEPQLAAQQQQLSDMHQQQKSWFEKFSRRLFAQKWNIKFMQEQAKLQTEKEQEEDEARDEQWHAFSEDLVAANNEMEKFKRKYSFQKLDELVEQNRKNEEQCKRSVERTGQLKKRTREVERNVGELSEENAALRNQLNMVVGRNGELCRGMGELIVDNDKKDVVIDNTLLLLEEMFNAAEGKRVPELSPGEMCSPLPVPREEPRTPRTPREGSLTPRMHEETSLPTTPLHSPKSGSQTPILRPQPSRTELPTDFDLKEEMSEMSLNQLLYGQDQGGELSIQVGEQTDVHRLSVLAQVMSQDKPRSQYKKGRDMLESQRNRERGGKREVPLAVSIPKNAWWPGLRN